MSASNTKSSRRSWRRSVFFVETGPISGHSVPRDWPFFLNWEFWMILFRAEAIFTSSISKFGKFFPQTDREDFNSSIESTISASLIHNIASDGKSEQVVAWFLNRIFHTKNNCGVGNLSNCSSDICCLCGLTIEFCGNSTSILELTVDGLLANVGIGIVSLPCLSSLVKGVTDPVACWTAPRSFCGAQGWISWWWFRRRVNCRKLLTQNVFLLSRRIPCVMWQAFVAAQHAWNENLESLLVDWKRKTTFHYNLIPHLEILPNHSWNSFVLASPATEKWAFVLSHDFLLIFAVRFVNSQFLSSLQFSHFVHASDFEYLGEPVSFVDNSFCRRTCSRRNSMYPCCASCDSNLWAWACCCNSLMQLLRDPTLCSCLISSDFAWLSTWSLLPSRRDLPTFDGSAFLKTELLNWFQGSSFPNENGAAGFPVALGSWDELDIKLFLKSALSTFCTCSSLLWQCSRFHRCDWHSRGFIAFSIDLYFSKRWSFLFPDTCLT